MPEILLQKPVVESLATKLEAFDGELTPIEHDHLFALVALASSSIAGATGVQFDVVEADVVGFGNIFDGSGLSPWISLHWGTTTTVKGGDKTTTTTLSTDGGVGSKPTTMTTGTGGSATLNK